MKDHDEAGTIAADDATRSGDDAERADDGTQPIESTDAVEVVEAVEVPEGRTLIDPRGPRFGAAITVVVLAIALLTIPSITSVILLVAQALVFGAAAMFGLRAQPYGWVYREYIRPRLGPPAELEDEAPPRFAQQVGLVFVLVALVGLALSAPIVAQVATALALAAAFLNAAFNFCLGCEIYLLVQRVRSRRAKAVDETDLEDVEVTVGD